MEGQEDLEMKGKSQRRGHTFQMIAVALLPEGGKESSIILALSKAICIILDHSCCVIIKQCCCFLVMLLTKDLAQKQ